jgi:hypothetical protein
VIGDPFTSDCRKASMALQSAALRVSFHTATVSFAVALMSCIRRETPRSDYSRWRLERHRSMTDAIIMANRPSLGDMAHPTSHG